MGSAMGNLPNHTSIRVFDPATKKELTVVKRDIGAGGSPVGGYPREIDLYAPAARTLANAGCSWTGVVLWQRTHK